MWRWRTTILPPSRAATDVLCPGLDNLPLEYGCQILCQDANCTRAQRAMDRLRRWHSKQLLFASYSCCPPFTGCYATIKEGEDPYASLEGPLCDRVCHAKLERDAFYRCV